MRIRIFPAFLAVMVAAAMSVLTGCVLIGTHTERSSGVLVDYSPSDTVRRQESIQIAESYRSHQWRPTKANIFHGNDAQGIRVDTPDIDFQPPADSDVRSGWWRAGKANVGIPYQWGGFDTPQEFDQKVAAGFFAGDVYTSAKRAQLDDAVSQQACGVDCSGFISRCWRLSRSFSTRELADLCEELTSFDDLLPGDVVNKHNSHVLLFVEFLDAEKTRFLAYETGSPPTWKVLRHPIEVAYVEGLGYRPYRYRGIRD